MVSFISAGQKKNDEVLYIYAVRICVAALLGLSIHVCLNEHFDLFSGIF